jgi:hypothetical protein
LNCEIFYIDLYLYPERRNNPKINNCLHLEEWDELKDINRFKCEYEKAADGTVSISAYCNKIHNLISKGLAILTEECVFGNIW